MIHHQLKGLGVAMITPFLQNGTIDFNSLELLVEDLIKHGADYLVALGTTSESPTLSEQEKTEVVKTIVSTVNQRVPVVMGIGGPCTAEIVHKITNTDLTGISAILSVTPYYNRPSQEGLYEHYMEIGRRSPLPVILYNVRSRTACNLEAETTLKLASDCQNIIGIKEASGNMNQIMKVVKHKPQDFLVISGDDAITLPLMAAGIDGLISVVANAYPKEVAQMIHFAMQDHFTDARKIHHHLLDITQACFKEGNPAGVKTFLAIQGKIGYHLRLPLTRVSTELQKYIKEIATI